MDISILSVTQNDRCVVYWLHRALNSAIGYIHHQTTATAEIDEDAIGFFHAVHVSNEEYLAHWSNEKWEMTPHWHIDLFLRADLAYDAGTGERQNLKEGQSYQLVFDSATGGCVLDQLEKPFYSNRIPRDLVALLIKEAHVTEPLIMGVVVGFKAGMEKRGSIGKATFSAVA